MSQLSLDILAVFPQVYIDLYSQVQLKDALDVFSRSKGGRKLFQESMASSLNGELTHEWWLPRDSWVSLGEILGTAGSLEVAASPLSFVLIPE